MPRAYWLVKTEPSTYAWADLVREKKTAWDGVRNAQARLHLLGMKKGNFALVYHSGAEKAVVGIAKVTRAAFPDPSAEDPRWVAVELASLRGLAEPVPLATVKRDRKLAEMALVRQSRLSVMPATRAEFERILAHGKTKAPR